MGWQYDFTIIDARSKPNVVHFRTTPMTLCKSSHKVPLTGIFTLLEIFGASIVNMQDIIILLFMCVYI